MKIGICQNIFVKIRSINKFSIKISPFGIHLFHVGRIQTDMRKLIFGFSNCFGKVWKSKDSKSLQDFDDKTAMRGLMRTLKYCEYFANMYHQKCL